MPPSLPEDSLDRKHERMAPEIKHKQERRSSLDSLGDAVRRSSLGRAASFILSSSSSSQRDLVPASDDRPPAQQQNRRRGSIQEHRGSFDAALVGRTEDEKEAIRNGSRYRPRDEGDIVRYYPCASGGADRTFPPPSLVLSSSPTLTRSKSASHVPMSEEEVGDAPHGDGDGDGGGRRFSLSCVPARRNRTSGGEGTTTDGCGDDINNDDEDAAVENAARRYFATLAAASQLCSPNNGDSQQRQQEAPTTRPKLERRSSVGSMRQLLTRRSSLGRLVVRKVARSNSADTALMASDLISAAGSCLDAAGAASSSSKGRTGRRNSLKEHRNSFDAGLKKYGEEEREVIRSGGMYRPREEISLLRH